MNLKTSLLALAAVVALGTTALTSTPLTPRASMAARVSTAAHGHFHKGHGHFGHGHFHRITGMCTGTATGVTATSTIRARPYAARPVVYSAAPIVSPIAAPA